MINLIPAHKKSIVLYNALYSTSVRWDVGEINFESQKACRGSCAYRQHVTAVEQTSITHIKDLDIKENQHQEDVRM